LPFELLMLSLKHQLTNKHLDMKFLLTITLVALISFQSAAKPKMNANAKSWLMGSFILGGVATATTGAFLYGNKPKLGASLLAIGGTFTLTGALLNINGNGCKNMNKF